MITTMPGPGRTSIAEAGEEDGEAGDRDRDPLAVAGDEAGDDLERDEGRVVMPAAGELRSGRLQLFDQLRGIDLLGFVSPDLVPEWGSALLGVFLGFSGHEISSLARQAASGPAGEIVSLVRRTADGLQLRAFVGPRWPGDRIAPKEGKMSVSAADRFGHSRDRLRRRESAPFRAFALAVIVLELSSVGGCSRRSSR